MLVKDVDHIKDKLDVILVIFGQSASLIMSVKVSSFGLEWKLVKIGFKHFSVYPILLSEQYT